MINHKKMVQTRTTPRQFVADELDTASTHCMQVILRDNNLSDEKVVVTEFLPEPLALMLMTLFVRTNIALWGEVLDDKGNLVKQLGNKEVIDPWREA